MDYLNYKINPIDLDKIDNPSIEFKNVTKDYKKGRGIFNLSFKIPKGKCFGFCGTNGAGKTTSIRHIMGFIKPDEGEVLVNGLNAWQNSDKLKEFIAYVPGEINFPISENGSTFLKNMAVMHGISSLDEAERLINMLQLDPTQNLKKMSKGMKQKTAIVEAFMRDAEILILDEPTTGLDPLMRKVFKTLIHEKKEKGVTIFMSAHMFDELGETCDYVGFLKDGHLIDVVDMEQIRNRPFKEYYIKFSSLEDYQNLDVKTANLLSKDDKDMSIIIRIDKSRTKQMLHEAIKINIEAITEVHYSLEQYFHDNIIKGGKYDTSKTNEN